MRRLASVVMLPIVAACSGGGNSNTPTGATTVPSTPVLASITLAPSAVTVVANATQQFSAAGKDALGNAFTVTPTWSVVAGGGAISNTGLFTAGNSAGTFSNTVLATSGAVSGAATVTVILPPPIDGSALASGKILFSATGSSNPDGPYRLFVMNADGTGHTQLSIEQGNYQSPTIEKVATGGWRLAYSLTNELRTFTTATGTLARFTTPLIGDRPALSADAATVVYQGGASATYLNIWAANADGSGSPRAVTTYLPPGAEWPYFVGSTKLLVLAGGAPNPIKHRVVALDGSSDVPVPVPGGNTTSHSYVRPDGSEFLSAQNLTTYNILTGAVGTINDLKGTTTLLAQLTALGLAPIPTASYPGQAGQGSFALSVDWSRDGTRLLFDAAVQDATTGVIKGVAIFTWDLAAKRLVLIYGPELMTPARTNNFNYSLGTPRWIP